MMTYSLTFSPWTANYTLPEFPESPGDPCTEPDKICDFKPDCPGAEDEAKCGEFLFCPPLRSVLNRPATVQGIKKD